MYRVSEIPDAKALSILICRNYIVVSNGHSWHEYTLLYLMNPSTTLTRYILCFGIMGYSCIVFLLELTSASASRKVSFVSTNFPTPATVRRCRVHAALHRVLHSSASLWYSFLGRFASKRVLTCVKYMQFSNTCETRVEELDCARMERLAVSIVYDKMDDTEMHWRHSKATVLLLTLP